MPSLTIHISDDCWARLMHEHRFSQRAVQELAEAAVEEAALRAAPDIKGHAEPCRCAMCVPYHP